MADITVKNTFEQSIEMYDTDFQVQMCIRDSPNGCVYMLEKPEDILRKFKKAVTDSEACVRFDPADKPGVSNLMQIYAVATGKSFETIEQEFAGHGYGDFKPVSYTHLEVYKRQEKRSGSTSRWMGPIRSMAAPSFRSLARR